MYFVFDAKKIIQCIAYLMRKEQCRETDYLKPLKLLYLADRLSLSESGLPITSDTAYAMKKGPVLSRTYDLMKTPSDWESVEDAVHEREPEEALWIQFFESAPPHTLRMKADPGDGELTDHDADILDRIFHEYGGLNGIELSELTHSLPEWRKNYLSGTSRPIPLEDILDAVGMNVHTDEILQARAGALRKYESFNPARLAK
jgi:uncharacterized phage-associated protein